MHLILSRGGRGWGRVFTFHRLGPGPVWGTTRERATAMTQACADALGTVITQHTSDWHMMQRVFIDDLDPARLPVAHGAA